MKGAASKVLQHQRQQRVDAQQALPQDLLERWKKLSAELKPEVAKPPNARSANVPHLVTKMTEVYPFVAEHVSQLAGFGPEALAMALEIAEGANISSQPHVAEQYFRISFNGLMVNNRGLADAAAIATCIRGLSGALLTLAQAMPKAERVRANFTYRAYCEEAASLLRQLLRLQESSQGVSDRVLQGTLIALGTAADNIGHYDLALTSLRRNCTIKKAQNLPTLAVEKHCAEIESKIAAMKLTPTAREIFAKRCELELSECEARREAFLASLRLIVASHRLERQQFAANGWSSGPRGPRKAEGTDKFDEPKNALEAAVLFRTLVGAAKAAVQAKAFAEAEENYLRALALSRDPANVDEVTKHDQVVVLGSLGFVYCMKAQQESQRQSLEYKATMAKAVPQYRTAISLMEDLRKGGAKIANETMESALYQLGIVACNIERPDAGYHLLKRCKVLKQRHGADVSVVDKHLAAVEKTLARREQELLVTASKKYEARVAALKISSAVTMQDAIAMSNKAKQLMTDKNLKEAETAALTAVQMFDTLSDQNPHVTGTNEFRQALTTAGAVHYTIGQSVKANPAAFQAYNLIALNLYTRALTALNERVSDKDDPAFAPTEFNLACACVNLERYQSAVEHFTRCRRVKEKAGQDLASVDQNLQALGQKVEKTLDVASDALIRQLEGGIARSESDLSGSFLANLSIERSMAVGGRLLSDNDDDDMEFTVGRRPDDGSFRVDPASPTRKAQAGLLSEYRGARDETWHEVTEFYVEAYQHEEALNRDAVAAFEASCGGDLLRRGAIMNLVTREAVARRDSLGPMAFEHLELVRDAHHNGVVVWPHSVHLWHNLGSVFVTTTERLARNAIEPRALQERRAQLLDELEQRAPLQMRVVMSQELHHRFQWLNDFESALRWSIFRGSAVAICAAAEQLNRERLAKSALDALARLMRDKDVSILTATEVKRREVILATARFDLHQRFVGVLVTLEDKHRRIVERTERASLGDFDRLRLSIDALRGRQAVDVSCQAALLPILEALESDRRRHVEASAAIYRVAFVFDAAAAAESAARRALETHQETNRLSIAEAVPRVAVQIDERVARALLGYSRDQGVVVATEAIQRRRFMISASEAALDNKSQVTMHMATALRESIGRQERHCRASLVEKQEVVHREHASRGESANRCDSLMPMAALILLEMRASSPVAAAIAAEEAKGRADIERVMVERALDGVEEATRSAIVAREFKAFPLLLRAAERSLIEANEAERRRVTITASWAAAMFCTEPGGIGREMLLRYRLNTFFDASVAKLVAAESALRANINDLALEADGAATANFRQHSSVHSSTGVRALRHHSQLLHVHQSESATRSNTVDGPERDERQGVIVQSLFGMKHIVSSHVQRGAHRDLVDAAAIRFTDTHEVVHKAHLRHHHLLVAAVVGVAAVHLEEAAARHAIRLASAPSIVIAQEQETRRTLWNEAVATTFDVSRALLVCEVETIERLGIVRSAEHTLACDFLGVFEGMAIGSHMRFAAFCRAASVLQAREARERLQLFYLTSVLIEDLCTDELDRSGIVLAESSARQQSILRFARSRGTRFVSFLIEASQMLRSSTAFNEHLERLKIALTELPLRQALQRQVRESHYLSLHSAVVEELSRRQWLMRHEEKLRAVLVTAELEEEEVSARHNIEIERFSLVPAFFADLQQRVWLTQLCVTKVEYLVRTEMLERIVTVERPQREAYCKLVEACRVGALKTKLAVPENAFPMVRRATIGAARRHLQAMRAADDYQIHGPQHVDAAARSALATGLNRLVLHEEYHRDRNRDMQLGDWQMLLRDALLSRHALARRQIEMEWADVAAVLVFMLLDRSLKHDGFKIAVSMAPSIV